MTGEISQLEREAAPESQVFNVDAMSDDQIIVLYRAFGEIAHSAASGDGGIEEEDIGIESNDAVAVGDGMWNQLVAGVRDLVARDPQRVRALMGRCVGSPVEIDREFAVEITPALIDYDYFFTRDTLVRTALYQDDLNSPSFSDARDSAWDQVAKLMRDRLTPEQVVDFQAYAAILDPTWPVLEPAGPDED